jgi:hypothetical protein
MRVGDASQRDGKISTEPLEKLSKQDKDTCGERVSAPRGAADEPSPFARILRGLGREVDRGENLVKRAISGPNGGQDMGNVELLALQAGVYRYSEAVDLSAKLVDRAASGVKTVLQGQ